MTRDIHPLAASRRGVLGAGLVLALPRLARAAPADAQAAIAGIEAQIGGRVGVAAVSTADGRRIGHRADARFPMCSTFKLPLAAAVLARIDAGSERAERRIAYGAADLLGHAPVTRAHLAEGAMSVRDLAAAAMTQSDNTAANLLLAAIGGPPAVTAFLRGLGDPVTRLDRNEPDLNTALEGDPRDTTSPAAMLADLRRLTLGDALSRASREQLVAWLAANTTGDARIRAGVPKGWKVGDKTGTGAGNTANDVAMVWPPGRPPVLIAVYVFRPTAAPATVDGAIARIGRLALSALA